MITGLYVQVYTRLRNNVGNTIDPGLRCVPVSGVNSIADSWEESLVVTGPGLRGE